MSRYLVHEGVAIVLYLKSQIQVVVMVNHSVYLEVFYHR